MMNSAAMLAWRATRMTMWVRVYLPRPWLCGVFGALDAPLDPDPPDCGDGLPPPREPADDGLGGGGPLRGTAAGADPFDPDGRSARAGGGGAASRSTRAGGAGGAVGYTRGGGALGGESPRGTACPPCIECGVAGYPVLGFTRAG